MCISISSQALPSNGLVVSLSNSQVVGLGFKPWPGNTKDHHRNCTNCFLAWHACIRVGVWHCSLTL